MSKLLKIALLAGLSVTALPAGNLAYAEGDLPVIALSNSFYGNTWRQQMVESFEAAAEQAKAEGRLADYIVMNGDGSVAQQNSQLAELILRGVDVLLINAASETALNSTIERACQAGIIVVSFDSVASAPCNYQLNFDFLGYKAEQAEAVMDMIGGEGNVIIVRGVRGSAPDNDMYNAQQSVLQNYPNVNVVATVHGQATASEAQAAIANVLPSLPKIDAVLAQGGSDDIGIAQAFEQYGGEYADDMPIIEGGGGTDFIKWWAEQNAENGYNTISMNTTPGIGGAALWLGVALAEGAEAPKKMIMPVATITAENLAEYADEPAGRIVSPEYSLQWVEDNLLSN
jgi:ribose transport system substrate-binding protein